MKNLKYKAWCEKYKLMLPVERIDFDRGRQILVYVIIPDCAKYHDKLHNEIYGEDTCRLFGSEEVIITYDLRLQGFPVFESIYYYDKNKKELYVGDIVKRKGVEKLQEIISTGSRISLRSLPDNDDYEDVWKIPSCDLEYMGNLYEKPELLNA
jgi:hypothetical protein